MIKWIFDLYFCLGFHITLVFTCNVVFSRPY